MSAAAKALDAVEAAGKAATARPWVGDYDGLSQAKSPYDTVISEKEARGYEAGPNGLTFSEEDKAFIVAAVNLSSPLAAVARAAMAYRAAQDAADALPPTLYSDGRGGVSEALGLIEVTRQEIYAALDALEAAAAEGGGA